MDMILDDKEPTVVICFLEVHVHDSSTDNRSHLVTIKCLDLGEHSWLNLVAAVLGEEDWDVEALELLDDLIIAGFSVRGVTAPRVDVVSPEVNGFLFLIAVEVGGHVFADLSVVVGCIADTHWTVFLILDVGLHITDGSLNESTGIGVGAVVGDLVTGKETNDIRVLGHLVNDGGVAGIQDIIPLGVIADDGSAGLRKVGHNVDASILEQLHTLLVVLLGVDSVHTDGVGLQLLHQGDITLAGLYVCKGILVAVISAAGAIG